MAYVAQQAWIQNATLRDNILFSGEFLDSIYHDVVDACALQQDLDMLQAGDHTEISEKVCVIFEDIILMFLWLIALCTFSSNNRHTMTIHTSMRI